MSIANELHAVEQEITAIYGRSCKDQGDRARLAHLKQQQARLTTARRKERAETYDYGKVWSSAVARKGRR